VYGAGEGVSSGSRARAAQRGATIGGVAGGLLGGASPLVSDAAENVIGMFRRSDVDQIAKEFGISRDAAKVIRNTFEMGGSVDDAAENLRRAGSEAMIADAGEAGQVLLDATAASGPAGSSAVRSALDDRATRSAQNLDTGLTGLLGQPAEGPKTAVQAIQRATAPQRRDTYDLAFNTPINYASQQGQGIEAVLDRVDPKVLIGAIEEANQEMKSLGLSNQQIMAIIGDDGRVTFREMPNVRQLNEIKKALDAGARAARDPRTGIETQQSLRFSRLAAELREALVEATGGDQGTYKSALRLGGETIQEREAFQIGEKLLSPRTRVEDVRMAMGANPSAAQVAAAKSGLRTRVDEIVGNVRRIPSDPNIDARQMLANLREMGSDNARKKVRLIMGDEADDLFRMLDEASATAEVRAQTAVNSRTAVRQATQADVADITAPGAAGRAMRGEPIDAAKNLIQAVTGMTDEYSAAQRQRIYQDIARALTEKQGDAARAALSALRNAMDGQAMTDAQTQTLARLLAAGLYGSATSASTRGALPEYGPQ
jgi:hypothetical protein